MKTTITIGLDLAKSVFQVHGVDDASTPTIRRQLKRKDVLAFFMKLPPCVVGMEACGTAHHWAREIGRLGHKVKLMPPKYVKAVSTPVTPGHSWLDRGRLRRRRWASPVGRRATAAGLRRRPA